MNMKLIILLSTFKKSPLVSALKKLSRDNLANLTPTLYLNLLTIHPSLSKRLRSISLIVKILKYFQFYIHLICFYSKKHFIFFIIKILFSIQWV